MLPTLLCISVMLHRNLNSYILNIISYPLSAQLDFILRFCRIRHFDSSLTRTLELNVSRVSVVLYQMIFSFLKKKSSKIFH